MFVPCIDVTSGRSFTEDYDEVIGTVTSADGEHIVVVGHVVDPSVASGNAAPPPYALLALSSNV